MEPNKLLKEETIVPEFNPLRRSFPHQHLPMFSSTNWHSMPNILHLSEEKLDSIAKDYNQIKKLSSNLDLKLRKKVFEHSVRVGIIRNVKYLFPMLVVDNNRSDFLNHCMCIAIENANLDIVDYLLNNGTSLNYDNEKPIRTAIKGGHIESVQMLIRYGVNANIDNGKLLVYCCEFGDYPEILKCLIDNGINVFDNYSKALQTCWTHKRVNSEEILVKNFNKNESVKENEKSIQCHVDDDMEQFMNNYQSEDEFSESDEEEDE